MTDDGANENRITGNLVLSGPNSLTQNLTVVVSGGTLTLSGNGTLLTTGTSALTVNQGGTLTLDNGAINNLNRSHECRLLHFHGGGDGQSVAWRSLAGESRATPERT